MDNKITITVEDDVVGFNSEKPLHAEEFLTILFTTGLSFMQHITNLAPEDLQSELKGELYDLFNSAASRTLELFAPEFELRPNLTTQAILEAENEIVLGGRLKEVERGS